LNILFLSHRIPYPPNKGDKIRTFNILRYLSTRHNIYLGTILDQKPDKDYVHYIKPLCREIHAVYFYKKKKLVQNIFCKKPFSVANFYDRSLQGYVDKTLASNKINVVICFSSSIAEYVFNTPKFRNNMLDNVKLVMDYIDLDSDKWLQYSRYSKFPLNHFYKLENERLFDYEVKINQCFHHSLFVSQREFDRFKKLYPKAKNVKIIPNGIDYKYFKANKRRSIKNKKPILLFTGYMDYFANEDGVRWFSNNIFPKIKLEIPEAQFYIVGNKPTNKVKKLAKIKDVHVTGYVDDIREYYSIADLCVIPLRIARGLQNKVLEGMATGNALVATSNARNGIICSENVDIVIADDENSFANKCVSLLNDEKRRREIGTNAVKNIRKNYPWELNLKVFDEILE